MGVNREKFVRRNYFVNKGLQLRFSLLIFITTVVIGLIAVWTTYVTTWNEISAQVTSKQFYEKIDTAYKDAAGSAKSSDLIGDLIIIEFSNIFDQVSGVLVLRLLAGSLLLFLLSIFVSHKIAGPLWRMEKAVKSVGQGDLSVNMDKLRYGDELNELAGAINEVIIKLRKSTEVYHGLSEKIAQNTKKIADAKNKGKIDCEETKEAIDQLQVVAAELVTNTSQFKISSELKD